MSAREHRPHTIECQASLGTRCTCPASDGLPAEVRDAIDYEVARLELDYADNYRAYRVRDKVGIRKYRELELEGCCGEWIGHYIDRSGDKWIIACNHGH